MKLREREYGNLAKAPEPLGGRAGIPTQRGGFWTSMSLTNSHTEVCSLNPPNISPTAGFEELYEEMGTYLGDRGSSVHTSDPQYQTSTVIDGAERRSRWPLPVVGGEAQLQGSLATGISAPWAASAWQRGSGTRAPLSPSFTNAEVKEALLTFPFW